MDVNAFVSAMTVGATVVGPHVATTLGKIVGTEVAKEATKDGYKALKQAVGHVLGSKGRRATDRFEANPASQEAQQVLAKVLADVAEEDVIELDGKLKEFLAALSQDRAATAVAEAVASIKLDIDSGGNVSIKRVTGAQTVDVKSRSNGDFEFSDISLHGGGKSQGN